MRGRACRYPGGQWVIHFADGVDVEVDMCTGGLKGRVLNPSSPRTAKESEPSETHPFDAVAGYAVCGGAGYLLIVSKSEPTGRLPGYPEHTIHTVEQSRWIRIGLTDPMGCFTVAVDRMRGEAGAWETAEPTDVEGGAATGNSPSRHGGRRGGGDGDAQAAAGGGGGGGGGGDKKKKKKKNKYDPFLTMRQNANAAAGLTSVELDGTYIWSDTYDLTAHWLQRPCVDPDGAGQRGSATLDATIPESPVSSFAPPADLWEAANPEFTWNVWLSLPFKRIQLPRHCIVLARGLCQTLQLSSSNNGTPVHVTLITRMRNLNPGSRYQARGLHAQYPGVGNEYECEQILFHKVGADGKASRPFGVKFTKSETPSTRRRDGNDHSPDATLSAAPPVYSWSSYVWGRGTVPLMWSQTQKMTDVSPDIVIDDTPYKGVAAYWTRVWERYNTTRFTVINLLKNNSPSGVAASLAPAVINSQAQDEKEMKQQRKQQGSKGGQGGGDSRPGSGPTSPTGKPLLGGGFPNPTATLAALMSPSGSAGTGGGNVGRQGDGAGASGGAVSTGTTDPCHPAKMVPGGGSDVTRARLILTDDMDDDLVASAGGGAGGAPGVGAGAAGAAGVVDNSSRVSADLKPPGGGALDILAGLSPEDFAALAGGGPTSGAPDAPGNAAALARVLSVAERLDRIVVEAAERAARAAHRTHHNEAVNDLVWWDEAPGGVLHQDPVAAALTQGDGTVIAVDDTAPQLSPSRAGAGGGTAKTARGRGRVYVLASPVPVESVARTQPSRQAARAAGSYRPGDTVHVVREANGWLCLAHNAGWVPAVCDAARWLPLRGSPPATADAAHDVSQHDRSLGIEMGYPNYNPQEAPQTLMRYMSSVFGTPLGRSRLGADAGVAEPPVLGAADTPGTGVAVAGDAGAGVGSPLRQGSVIVNAGDDVIALGHADEVVFGGVIPMENVDEWSESSSGDESGDSDSDGGQDASGAHPVSPSTRPLNRPGEVDNGSRSPIDLPLDGSDPVGGRSSPQRDHAAAGAGVLSSPNVNASASSPNATRGTKVLQEGGVAYKGEALLSYQFEQSLHALDRYLARGGAAAAEDAEAQPQAQQTAHVPGAVPEHHGTQLYHFNWHGLVKRIGEKRTVEGLWQVLDPHLREFGVSAGVLYLDTESETVGPKGYPVPTPKIRRDRYQKGVPRFNCADSLDRTNLACFYCSVLVLAEQYRVLATADVQPHAAPGSGVGSGSGSPPLLAAADTPGSGDLSSGGGSLQSLSDMCSGDAWPLNTLSHDNALSEIPKSITESLAGTFVDNGDVCAIIYCNSPAMHSGLLRGYAGEAKEKQKKSNLSIALSRRYQNQFTDSKRTRALKLFLGRARALIVPYRRLTVPEAAASILVLNTSVMSAARIDSETLVTVFGGYGDVKALWVNPPPFSGFQASFAVPYPQILVLFTNSTAARHAANDEPNHRLQVGTAAFAKYMSDFQTALKRTKGRNTKAKVAFNQIKKFALSQFTSKEKNEGERGLAADKDRDREPKEKGKDLGLAGGFGKKLRGLSVWGKKD